MRTQATRCTQKQLAHLAHWQARGYTFGRNESAPESTLTPPSFATRHPILDALIGGMILLIGFGGMIAIWVSAGAGL